MQLFKDKIIELGKVYPGNVLKVDSFLNHQVDVILLGYLADELHKMYKEMGITKILTIETSGIMLACLTAQKFEVPMLFAKKARTSNLSEEVYSAPVFSYTHNREYTIIVDKNYLSKEDRVLLVDDFLANGCSLRGLWELVQKAGAVAVGAGVAIEKGFQGGGDMLRDMGLRVESMAIIESMDKDGILFRN